MEGVIGRDGSYAKGWGPNSVDFEHMASVGRYPNSTGIGHMIGGMCAMSDFFLSPES